MQKRIKSRITMIAAITLAIALSTQVAAATDSEFKGDRFYLGVGLTSTNLDISSQNLSQRYSGNTLSTFDHNKNAFKLFTGYRLDPFLALELGYTSFGEVIMTNNQNRQNIFQIDGGYMSAVGTQTLTNNIDAFVKGGMFFWSLYDANDNEIEGGQGLLYGAGLDINLYGDKKRSLQLEWERHHFSGVAISKADTIGVSLKFKF